MHIENMWLWGQQAETPSAVFHVCAYNELHLSHEINVFHAATDKEGGAGEQINLLFPRLGIARMH